MPERDTMVRSTALRKRDAASGGGMLKSWLGGLHPPFVDHKLA